LTLAEIIFIKVNMNVLVTGLLLFINEIELVHDSVADLCKKLQSYI
jgi:hypothetical protein